MTYSYDDTRDNEQLRLLTPAIDDFIARCKNPVPSPSTCPRQTAFFFPGGMGSQLKRATTKFVEGVATKQTFNYETVWLVPETFLGGARDLEMHRDGLGVFRDKGDRIIVANGSVNLAGITPHDGFITWCANNNVDLFVFDWDWRRRLDETVNFFVGKFLPYFQTRVLGAGCADPLAAFSLVGHSFGGMIVNLILRGNDPKIANVSRAITVGTPFYGYAGQQHRWFEGEPLLNGPLDIFKQDIIKVISSLPAVYTLLFLDEATFNDGTNNSRLTQDPNFPLAGYPSMDKATAGLRADPYNPQTNGSLFRYPATTGFNLYELDYARLQFQQMAAPMAPTQLAKFYNIRGVRTVNDTVGGLTWDWIPPYPPSPIFDGASVPGDDTQPAWTARLATNDPARCIAVTASDIQHVFLMSHPQVLDAIGSILCAPGAAMKPAVTPPPAPEPASQEDVFEFLEWLYAHRKLKKRWPQFGDKALLDSIPPEFRNRLGGIARRIMMDLVRGPTTRGARKPTRGVRAKSKAPRKKATKATARRARRRPGRK